MRRFLVSLTVVGLIAACGSDGSGSADGGTTSADGGDGASSTVNGDGGMSTSPPLPVSKCTVPAALADTSVPTTKVGTGSAASCTEAALRAAVSAGGIITFDCGAGPATIVVTSPLTPPTGKDTTLDGNGTVTISGGDATRILSLQNSYEKGSPTLTVQRLTLTKGKSTGTASNDGGAAISVLGANVIAIDAMFIANHGPASGQDTAGGAINNIGAGKTVIVGSRFEQNSCSNGGAIGALGSDLTIVNTVVANNTATGTGGNPGTGGNGGGVSMDGQGKTLAICGVTVSGNAGGAYGGAVFRTSYQTEATTIDQSTFTNNAIPDRATSQCGGVYLQGSHVTITSSSFTHNSASSVGAIAIYAHELNGKVVPGIIDMVNVTIADNQAWPNNDLTKTGLVGGITVGNNVTGAWQNVTIAANSAQFASGVGGAASGITITNSIISNNASNAYTPLNCYSTAKGANDLQWPANNSGNSDKDCVPGIKKGDPLLSAITADNVLIPGAGSPALGLGKACPPIDQLGNARKTDGCTAGAIEVP